MRIAAALILLAAAPAAAQVSTGNVPGAAAVAQFSRELGVNSSSRHFHDGARGGDPAYEDTIRRAGAWGECVAAAAPVDSRNYLLAQRTTSLLRWNFRRCERKVGQFAGADLTRVRRAAILDALRTTAG